MNLSNITPAKGSTHSEKRIGRGQGSGHGGTSTRGHKGAQSRSGYKHKRGFQGGQMPLHRRLPKFGFTNINKVVFKTVNLLSIEALAQKGVTTIGQEQLVAAGLVSKNDVIKILGTGTLSKKVDVTAHAFSKSAQAAIEAQGGTATKL
ncbi:MAG TPA: 50S ribosomal protein L15 [Candidatus Rikenella faecigallinarum]|uniref:Large ribosomal subunit protein uL15 n=1 Tax=Candidatus Rikenella faecigallinarum TaxID=2838745 RepID=A0A9D1QD89_9BACT|nr:50S ribosomal protein L15 [Candidatus Rikenella faecigallinarum]